MKRKLTFIRVADVPPCFYDSSVSLGGELCVAEMPLSERIDCHPESSEVDAQTCLFCSETPADGTPKCFRPREQGYRLVGDVIETDNGYSATLERINTPSWFGSEIVNVLLEVEFQTSDRLRIKVRFTLTTEAELFLLSWRVIREHCVSSCLNFS